jgi:hypothetical protein
MVRGTRGVFWILGTAFLLGGAALAVWGYTSDSPFVESGGVMSGVTLLVTGAIFLAVGKYMSGLDSSKTLTNGIPGTAQVTGVRDTGVTLNSVNAVIKASVIVSVEGREPYPAEVRFVLGRTQWGAIQPGMTIPVKVDPADPQTVVFDPDRPVIAGGMPGMSPTASGMFGTMAGAMPGATGGAAVGSAALGQQVQMMSAADIIANGQPTEGVLHAVEPTGMTAGQVAPHLAPHEADDPISKVVFTYTPSGGAEQRVEALVRVPDLKGHYLRQGERIPVAYVPNGPATIDWSRL